MNRHTKKKSGARPAAGGMTGYYPEVSAKPVNPKVVRVAAALFWRNGYSATSTRQLADGLGFRKASLYYHIRRKEDLLYEICTTSLRRVYDSVKAATGNENDPRRRVTAMINAHVKVMVEEKDMFATMVTELRSFSPANRKVVIGMRSRYESLVESVLRKGQAAGLLRTDIPAKMLTYGLLDLLNWAIFWFNPRGRMRPGALAGMFATLYLDGAGGSARTRRNGAASGKGG